MRFLSAIVAARRDLIAGATAEKGTLLEAAALAPLRRNGPACGPVKHVAEPTRAARRKPRAKPLTIIPPGVFDTSFEAMSLWSKKGEKGVFSLMVNPLTAISDPRDCRQDQKVWSCALDQPPATACGCPPRHLCLNFHAPHSFMPLPSFSPPCPTLTPDPPSPPLHVHVLLFCDPTPSS